MCLDTLLLKAKEILKAKKLIIVCNTKGPQNTDSHSTCNLDTEYFSDSEFEEIVAMFSAINVPMDFFTYEEDFFRHVLDRRAHLSDILVYNAAQSGTGAGRKSLVPAFCNLYHLACTGSNAYVVSLCRHKYHVNKLIGQSGISVPKTWIYYGAWLMGQAPPKGTKIILKPIYESASIGIGASAMQIYKPHLDSLIREQTIQLQQPMIAQEFIAGYEVEVPLIRTAEMTYLLPPVGISVENKRLLGDTFLDYDCIYFDRYSFYDFCEESQATADLQKCATDVAMLLGMEGLCRVDFRIIQDGTYYVTDVSTNPHFVKHSSVCFAYRKLGLEPKDIARTILGAATMKG